MALEYNNIVILYTFNAHNQLYNIFFNNSADYNSGKNEITKSTNYSIETCNLILNIVKRV